MVAARITWLYGGRHVLLSGSFTGWTNHIIMTLLENSTRFFPAISNLPPGHHQYKFLVNGVWWINEEQQYDTDENEASNNIILVEEPELVYRISQSEASSSSSSMEVDYNAIFQHPTLFSGDMHQDIAFADFRG